MPALDRYAPFLLAAFAVTWLTLGTYLLYLRSRLDGLHRQVEHLESAPPGSGGPSGAAPGRATQP